MSTKKLDNNTNIDHFCTPETVCPHCGHEGFDSWELDGDFGETECSNCEKEYYYERYVDVTYNTFKTEEEANRRGFY